MFALNGSKNYGSPLPRYLSQALGAAGSREAQVLVESCPDYHPTELFMLPRLAAELGLETLAIKDEGTRFGLGSFKALGGAYAVIRLVLRIAAEKLGRPVSVEELFSQQVREIAGNITIGCATDGNHGRSVAFGARLVGACAKIFVHSGVSTERCDAMIQLGAQIIRVEGAYDDSVKVALETCARNDWEVVSDTSWPGYIDTPLIVMQGYTIVLREALAQLDQPPTHVFLQAGVGGFAAACATFLKTTLGDLCPKLVVVEPSRAACLFESMRADTIVKVGHGKPTVMAMLECYEPSLVAWEALSRLADFFMTIDEDEAVEAMRSLACPQPGDPAIVAGESGGVGLGALKHVLGVADLAAQLQIDGCSRVLLINTEGATDPVLYAQYVGVSELEVFGRNERAS